MTDQPEPDIPDNIIDITPPSSSIPRISAWTGRLPPELFMKILEILGERGDTDPVSLCRLQRTSSAVYWIVTPIVYRHLKLTMKSAVQLFDVFNRIPATDRRSILDQLQPGVDHIYPTDIPLIHRLRWMLSKTRSITLDIPLDQ
jgi:hypothetical protein